MDKDYIEVQLQKLKHGDAPARYTAAARLGKLGDKNAVEHLLAALADLDQMVLDNVIFALGELGDARAVYPLIRLVRTGGSERLRKSAAKALGLLGNPDAIDALVVALSDKDFKVRKSAARSLGQIGDERAAPALAAAVDDPDYTVGKHAQEALARINSKVRQ